jgi:8-oxo-dGTP pyrophosphatase MutT (NUDIX family)
MQNLNEELSRLKQMMGINPSNDLINEEKADRCLRIARRKYDKPSAYRSGAIVRCRQGKIWKDLKEEDINDAPDDIKDLLYKAHDGITRTKGKEYAPDSNELQAWIDDHLDNEESMDEAKKTDYSKEKKSGLHGWFSRRGGDGNKGWVDCNTCRKDSKTGRKKCKACGREKGEKRSKYPSCRPTPASCGTPGKGKKWGKTKNESTLNEADDIKRVALLFIVLDNKTLLFKRSKNETTNPSKYGMLGGGMVKGETPEEAIVREVFEEAGVELTSFKPLEVYDYGNVELNVFYTNEFDVDNIELDENEHVSYKFFTMEELMNMAPEQMISTNKDIANDYNEIAKETKKLNEEISKMKTMMNVMGEMVTDTKVICDGCGWSWAIEDGGEDTYTCHKCGYNNTPATLNEEMETITWGEVSKALQALKDQKTKQDAIGAAKGFGKLGASLIPGIDFISNAVGVLDNLNDTASVAKALFGIAKNVTQSELKSPKDNKFKQLTGAFWDAIKLSPKLSEMLDDKMEVEFINQVILPKISKPGNENEALPNMDVELGKWLNKQGLKVASDVHFTSNFGNISENTFMGNHVWNYIKSITPDEDDIPWGFKDKIRSSEFENVDNFDLESLLQTDADFKEYYESGDERYDYEMDDIDPSDINNEIVVVDGELLDGYSRAATLLRNGEKTTNAFVGKNTTMNEEEPKNLSEYIKQRGDKWYVVSKKGKTLGKHETEREALAQLRAIEINKNK